MITPYDAAQRAMEIHDCINMKDDAHDPSDVDFQVVYDNLSNCWAWASERWDDQKPCVPFWVMRNLRRFANNYQMPMREYLRELGVDDIAA